MEKLKLLLSDTKKKQVKYMCQSNQQSRQQFLYIIIQFMHLTICALFIYHVAVQSGIDLQVRSLKNISFIDRMIKESSDRNYCVVGLVMIMKTKEASIIYLKSSLISTISTIVIMTIKIYKHVTGNSCDCNVQKFYQKKEFPEKNKKV